MKRKRLNYDSWGFQYFPYFQMRVDCDDFHGIAAVIKILDGELQCWETPKAGPLQVCGKGMMWMQLIPDGQKRLINVKFFPWGGEVAPERKNYPLDYAKDAPRRTSFWYVDVIDGFEYDADGVVAFYDKYIDVIFTPEGDLLVDDRDELEAAYASGELTKEQYEEALREAEAIQNEMCRDDETIRKTCEWTERVRQVVDGMIFGGAKPMYLFHGSPVKMDVIEPRKAGGQDVEGLCAVYAGESLHDVAPFALPIQPYKGNRCFSCDDGITIVECGYVLPDDHGYVYRLKPDTFHKVDGWEWVSEVPVEPTEVLEIPVEKMMPKVRFTEEAQKIQDEIMLSRQP